MLSAGGPVEVYVREGYSESPGLRNRPTLEYAVSVEGTLSRGLAAVEIEVSYDAALLEVPVWTSNSLHFVRIEKPAGDEAGIAVARILSDIDPMVGGGLGSLVFGLNDPEAIREPEVRKVLGISADGKIADLTAMAKGKMTCRTGDGLEYALGVTVEVIPNPSRGTMQMRFGLPLAMGESMGFALYDVRGRLVRTVYDGVNDGVLHAEDVGTGRQHDDALPSGVYFARLYVDGRTLRSEKVVILR